jgi:hypothetical protein
MKTIKCFNYIALPTCMGMLNEKKLLFREK